MPPDTEERRPDGGAAPMTSATKSDQSIPTTTGRRYWARRMIDRAAPTWPIPRYGSPEWLQLADGSPVKVAAVVIAAECWATSGEEAPERMAVAAEAARAAFKADEDADYIAAYREHQRRWRHLRVVGKHDDAGGPRPGDHQGGPVPWNGGEA